MNETPLHDAINNDRIEIALLLLKVRLGLSVWLPEGSLCGWMDAAIACRQCERAHLRDAVKAFGSRRIGYNFPLFAVGSMGPTATRSTAMGSPHSRSPAPKPCATPCKSLWYVSICIEPHGRCEHERQIWTWRIPARQRHSRPIINLSAVDWKLQRTNADTQMANSQYVDRAPPRATEVCLAC